MQQPEHPDFQHQNRNEVQEALEKWKTFWGQFGSTILLVILIVAVVFAGRRFYTYYTKTSHNSAWTDLASTETPQGLAAVANDHGNEAVKFSAMLRSGDAYLKEAVFGTSFMTEESEAGAEADAEAGTNDGSMARKQNLDRAAAMYEQLLSQDPPAIFAANARLGLASVAESNGKWDEASKQYDQVMALASDDLPALASLAATRQEMLADLQEPVSIVDAAPTVDAADTLDEMVPQTTEIVEELIIPEATEAVEEPEISETIDEPAQTPEQATQETP